MAKIAFTSIMFILGMFAAVGVIAMLPRALRSSLTFIREFRVLQKESRETFIPKDEK
jgi:hypothetical protein